jgi:hypothetical protein
MNARGSERADLRELEEGRAGVEQSVDAVPREQLPPRRVPLHRLRATPAQHLHKEAGEGWGARSPPPSSSIRRCARTRGAAVKARAQGRGRRHLGDAGAQVGKQPADGRGVARVGVGAPVERVREHGRGGGSRTPAGRGGRRRR